MPDSIAVQRSGAMQAVPLCVPKLVLSEITKAQPSALYQKQLLLTL